MKLSNEKLKIIKDNLNNLPQFKSYFSEKWLDKQLNLDEIHHPLFVILSDKNSSSKLVNNLKILKSNCYRYKRIIKKLKADKNHNNFFSTLTEIDVISYYYQQNNDQISLEYEPSVPGGKKLDLKMNIKGIDYFFEILTVFEDAKLENYSNLKEKIREELENINLPVTINFMIKKSFEKEYVTTFINFMKETIKKDDKTNSKFDFYENNEIVANFRYLKSDTNKCIANGFGPPTFSNPHGRTKEKILKKAIEQIPHNQNNIIVVNLSHVLNTFIVIEEALCELGIKIDQNNLKETYHRVQNGIFDYKNSSHIAMIIAYINSDYKNYRRFYFNYNVDYFRKVNFTKNLKYF